MLGYTTAVHKYQTQLQQQQQQQAATASSTSDRKLLQSGGRSPSYSPEFAAAYTAAVQKYLIQLQQQQQQQVAAASTSDATSGADGSRRLLQTGGRAPGFSAEFIAAYTAAVQKHQAEVRLQQQQQQQQGVAAMSEVHDVEGGRKLQQTGGRSPAYNDAFMAGYNAAVRQYQALLLQQKQQQQVQAAAASRPAASSGN
jgi:hypothetical protein